jgi:tight adherence protein C
VLLLFTLSLAITVGLVVLLVADTLPARSRAVQSRMSEMGLDGLLSTDAVARRARQQSRLRDLIEYLGGRVESRRGDWGPTRLRLIQAGYREPRALGIYLGLRLGAPILFGLYGLFLGTIANISGPFALTAGAVGLLAGWFLPSFVLSMRVSRRQKEIQKALPDALDLLVICVEAGLGLNQALVRVATEMRHTSRIMTEELSLANMAIRAGTPRDQALMDLSERTGVPEVRSLATMLIQTERFGTSIAHSLRVHAEGMRTKRRQRAEEAAAKTTIKMIFPLALCIFPALFVVILGPALISIIQSLSQI